MLNKKNNEMYGVIGLGHFGSALAKTLSEAGKDVLVLDCNESKIKEALSYTDHAYTVDHLSKETLQEAGIRNCDTVIVCIGEKIDTSILTVLTVIGLGVKRVIAKAISYEQGIVLEKLGAEVVYPERDMAVRLANKLTTSRIMEYITLSEEIDISELKLTRKLNDITIVEANLRKKFGLNIIALKHNGETSIEIEPDQMLMENDIIVVVGKRLNIKQLENYLNV
jgi:K+ transport systems, NAD-binding component